MFRQCLDVVEHMNRKKPIFSYRIYNRHLWNNMTVEQIEYEFWHQQPQISEVFDFIQQVGC